VTRNYIEKKQQKWFKISQNEHHFGKQNHQEQHIQKCVLKTLHPKKSVLLKIKSELFFPKWGNFAKIWSHCRQVASSKKLNIIEKVSIGESGKKAWGQQKQICSSGS
jgi:hypothetical protein